MLIAYLSWIWASVSSFEAVCDRGVFFAAFFGVAGFGAGVEAGVLADFAAFFGVPVLGAGGAPLAALPAALLTALPAALTGGLGGLAPPGTGRSIVIGRGGMPNSK